MEPLDWNPAVLSFTLSNLTHADGLYQGAFIHTIVFVGIATFTCLLIGYPFAYFLARRSGRFKGVFLLLFFAPFWISYMLRMLAWITLLQDQGYVNRALVRLGILAQPYPWLVGKPFTLIWGLIYGYVPFMVLPLFATLDGSIPHSWRPGATWVRVPLRRSGASPCPSPARPSSRGS